MRLPKLRMTATIPPTPRDHSELTLDARQRAMVLFWQHLTPEQRREYTRNQWFTAKSRMGREYRIQQHRVCLVVGRYVRIYCLVLRELAPVADQMLAKKIIIEKDEELFLRTAVDQGLHDPDEFGFGEES